MYDVINISFNFRVIVGILDAFHFDLRNSQHAVVNLPDAIAKKKAKGEITGKGSILFLNIVIITVNCICRCPIKYICAAG